MTDPQDSYWQNPYTYDPLGRVPPAPVEPPVFKPPPPPPYRPPVNVLATLSLVFAFVFAPVGAILGHAGLAQIRRTGELGRDRARAGLALSYAFIAVTVVALIAWATLGGAPSTQTAAPATTPTSAAAPPAPGPVAPDALAALLPGADALKSLTTDENIEAGQTWDNMGRSSAEGAIDRPECWGSVAPGTPDAYSGAGVTGYRAAEFRDSRSFLKSTQVIEAVVAFHDPAAAQAQLEALLSGWRRCGGLTVTLTPANGEALPFAVGEPADAPNGITTVDLAPRGLQIRSARAIAAKANVIVDLMVSCSGTTDSGQPRLAGVGIANYVLGKVPG
ncbi:nuclease PIN [Mycobacterium sp. 852014-52450_SCH5900713]|uniref:sensor domain-containing protein n=1 Tax=Mycobacterium sp. 852014-52450_SCH5900713 TaxID=1834116 RepID=UPI0007FF9CCC|nr:sensor domain-containing protein [Mycobacterium sp. 852014-52450_SCH5900713]OBF93489.1 nuclease PIN [Mycobacterium sp. 852014-52450_SCH5900713]